MALFDALREPSLSFVSGDQTYKLRRAWTNEDVFKIYGNALLIRDMLTEKSYAKFRKNHKTTEAILQLTRDSLSTLGVSGDHVYALLTYLDDDELFPYLESDLLQAGVSIEGLLDGSIPIRRAVAVYTALPDGCALHKKRNEPYSEWGIQEHMLAEIADLLNWQVQLQHVTAQVGGWKPKGKTKPPEPMFKRPEPEKKKVFNPTSDLLAFLGTTRAAVR